MDKNFRWPVPKEAFLAIVNHLVIEVLMGNLEVAKFDQAVNALIAVADDELQGELLEVKRLVKRMLADVG